MPLPKPNQNEKEQDFISRCIETMERMDTGRPHKQIQAMCYSAWRRAKGVKKAIVEKLRK